jgi:cysteine desulfurase
MAIYLDHNAGAPLRPEVRAALAAFVDDEHGNPASVHRAGQNARRALEHARVNVAALVGAKPRQIVFTSGGTESNDLAIFGAARAASGRRRVVSSAIEHSSVLAPLAELETQGFEVIRVLPDEDGTVAPSRVTAVIDSATALVTLGLANAEVGTVQDLAPVASAAVDAGALFHVDAAQAVGRIPVDVGALCCDLLTMSGHKLGAPAGTGALYVRDPSAIAPWMLGGPQESGLRAGTPNVLGAVGFGAAAEAVRHNFGRENPRIAALAGELMRRLHDAIAGLRLNGAPDRRLANTLNLAFPGVSGESMLIALDLEGVEVSMGSACAAGAVEPSHVLLAMGRGVEQARSSLRLSLGWNTTDADVARAAEIIPGVWRRVANAEPPNARAEARR